MQCPQVFDYKTACQYEVCFVAARGYSTFAQARAMTPARLREASPLKLQPPSRMCLSSGTRTTMLTTQALPAFYAPHHAARGNPCRSQRSMLARRWRRKRACSGRTWVSCSRSSHRSRTKSERSTRSLRRSDWHGNCGNRISFRKGLLGLEDFFVTPPCSRGQAHGAIMDSSPPPTPSSSSPTPR